MTLTDAAIASDPGAYVLQSVMSLLQNALAAPKYAAKFRGGVGITQQPEAAQEWISKGSKRPFLFLEIAHLEQDFSSCERGRWLVEVSIESVTLVASLPVERDLKAAVVAILSSSFDALCDLGIEESQVKAGQGRNTDPDRINPATLSAAICVAAP